MGRPVGIKNGQTSRIEKQCLVCGTTILVKLSRLDEKKYCSRKCRAIAFTQEGSPLWRGGPNRPELKIAKRISDRKYYKKNKCRIAIQAKEYREKTKEHINEFNRLYYKENHAEILRRRNERDKIKRKTPKFRLCGNIRMGMWQSLSGTRNRYAWQFVVGYTKEELKKHLEAQFRDGMTWENYGRGGWQIDHIIPISAFNFTSEHDIDFKRC